VSFQRQGARVVSVDKITHPEPSYAHIQITDLPWEEKTEEERQWWNEFEEEASDPRNWGWWADMEQLSRDTEKVSVQ
jgi:hypothetical protein